ncbi:MAG: cadherin-like domain-containing protein [Patescibacteria group bacterium]
MPSPRTPPRRPSPGFLRAFGGFFLVTALLLAAGMAMAVRGMRSSSFRASLLRPGASPAALHDSYTMEEDATFLMEAPGVLLNDFGDERGLKAILLEPPAHGALTLGTDGSFAYKPSRDFHGEDSFVYRAYAGSAPSAATTAFLTVTPVNDAPEEAADAYVLERRSPRTVPAAQGLLANDADADGDALTARIVSPPSSGVLMADADGSFTFVPASSTPGTVTFTYQADDGKALSAPALVTLILH